MTEGERNRRWNLSLSHTALTMKIWLDKIHWRPEADQWDPAHHWGLGRSSRSSRSSQPLTPHNMWLLSYTHTHTHFMQGFGRELGRLEQLCHFAGRQFSWSVNQTQTVETWVIPLLMFIQGDETAPRRRSGFLIHSRGWCMEDPLEKHCSQNRSIHSAPGAGSCFRSGKKEGVEKRWAVSPPTRVIPVKTDRLLGRLRLVHSYCLLWLIVALPLCACRGR